MKLCFCASGWAFWQRDLRVGYLLMSPGTNPSEQGCPRLCTVPSFAQILASFSSVFPALTGNHSILPHSAITFPFLPVCALHHLSTDTNFFFFIPDCQEEMATDSCLSYVMSTCSGVSGGTSHITAVKNDGTTPWDRHRE